MLAQTGEKCPPELWVNPTFKKQFWQPASHAIFYTHLLELQFSNIHHLQQHTGELCECLGMVAGIDLESVDQRPE